MRACSTANSEAKDRARQLILRFGWNTTCYQILNPGIDLWFCSAGDAVIGYVTRAGVRVVAGAPICSLQRLPDVLREWHQDADQYRKGVCYFGAEDRMCSALRDLDGYSTVVLGAQPEWTPAAFTQAIRENASLRYQLSRASHKDVVVREWPPQRARGHAGLRKCLDEWLTTRGLPTMHFLVEPDTLDCLLDRRLFVAERGGEPVGFVVLSPVPDRNGWLTEQFVRGFQAPNGTIELALGNAIREVQEAEAAFVTMGIVPLSSHGFSASQVNPAWLRFIMGWFRAHGRRFYNFDGLDAFKSKFAPDRWEPIYVISRERKFSFRTLYAIAAAFSDGPVILAGLKGVWRAIKQEIAWAKERLEPSRAYD
ncbi:MAG TPA: DUF2156 domain-containing protein [Fimbriimonas sp.]|nr:DUF2156 domain-containing protein [Fimbriimonas sp.]